MSDHAYHPLVASSVEASSTAGTMAAAPVPVGHHAYPVISASPSSSFNGGRVIVTHGVDSDDSKRPPPSPHHQPYVAAAAAGAAVAGGAAAGAAAAPASGAAGAGVAAPGAPPGAPSVGAGVGQQAAGDAVSAQFAKLPEHAHRAYNTACARLSPVWRLRICWYGGALWAFIWTLALFLHAEAHTSWSQVPSWDGSEWQGTSWRASNAEPPITMSWTILTFFLFSYLLGLILVYRYNQLSCCSWCRCRTRPEEDVEGSGELPTESDASAPGTPQPTLQARAAAMMQYPLLGTGPCTCGRFLRAVFLAIIPFGFLGAVAGVLYGMQIGALVAILNQRGVVAAWAFGMGLFAMVLTSLVVTGLSVSRRLSAVLMKVDPVLVGWINDQGLTPLGRFLRGFWRGFCLSGWTCLAGVLIGTVIGIPASMLGSVALIIIVLAIVIVCLVIRRYRKGAASNAIPAGAAPVPVVEQEMKSGAPAGAASGAAAAVAVVSSPSAPAHVAVEIQPQPISEVEMLYLRGLSLLHGDAYGNGKDSAMAASLIMQAAQRGHVGAQEHLRQLLMSTAPSTSTSPPPFAVHATAA